MLPPVFCLMGPTATGKTDIAIALAEKFPCEIISVDSAMIYRGMDIGTAKPPPLLRKKIPHYLIDICDPQESYSVGKFCHDAHQLIADILQRQKIPLLVGGTMMYFRALQQGISLLPEADAQIRAQIESEAQQYGWGNLHAKLQQIDPMVAARVAPQDTQRIQRALEIYYLTGKPLSVWHQQPPVTFSMPYRWINWILMPASREVLRQRIAQRFMQMLEAGLISEVKGLYARSDLHADLPAIRAVGYRQVWEYLSGNIDEAKMIQKAITASQQLAKRQLTWLKAWPVAHYFDYEAPDLFTHLSSFLPS